MASVAYGQRPFGLQDLKFTDITGATQEDVGAASMLSAAIEIKSGNVDGDDTRKGVHANIVAMTGRVEWAEASEEALAIVLGTATAASGTTPNEITTTTISGGQRLPYFKIYGKALEDGAGDDQIQLFKCKMTGGLEFKMGDGEIGTFGFDFMAIDDGTNGILDYVQDETAAALPAS